MSEPTPEFCARALELLGMSGGTLVSCRSFLPDQYHVTATSPAGDYTGVVVVEGGVPVTRRGCGAGAAWLRRIRVQELETVNAVALAEGLQWLGALPDGFTAAHLTDHEDRTGSTRFAKSPFRLELRAQEAVAPAAGATGIDLGPVHGGGGAPAQRRAILTGDAEYRFTWAIERREGGGEWQAVSTTACE